jgi:hypothetical protein
MTWSQYADEAHLLPTENTTEDVDVDIDDYYDPHPDRMEYEYWVDWYSRDLMNMWMSLRTYTRDASISSYVMTEATYDDFCTFMYNFSHGYPSPFPS